MTSSHWQTGLQSCMCLGVQCQYTYILLGNLIPCIIPCLLCFQDKPFPEERRRFCTCSTMNSSRFETIHLGMGNTDVNALSATTVNFFFCFSTFLWIYLAQPFSNMGKNPSFTMLMLILECYHTTISQMPATIFNRSILDCIEVILGILIASLMKTSIQFV